MQQELKEKIRALPLTPGVYLMKDSLGNIIYVGKAKQLRRRVQSYFVKSSGHSPKTRVLVSHIRDLEIRRTDTEFEAFLLECRLIKELRPAYNRKMKNPEAYTYITIHRARDGLRYLTVSYNPEDDHGLRRFGPYSSRGTVERAVDGIKECLRIMCSSPAGKRGPCLNHALGRCMGMCAGGSAAEAYEGIVNRIIQFLEGSSTEILEQMDKRMLDAAERFDFEAAARYRDEGRAVQYLLQKEKMISFAETGHISMVLEDMGVGIAKLFLIKGNRLLLNHRLSLPTEGAAEAIQAQEIGKLVSAAYAASGADKQSAITRFDVDEAQIIYSYLQSAAACCCPLEEAWLEAEADPSALAEAAARLLQDQVRLAVLEAAAGDVEAEEHASDEK
ncbi:MAG: UvrABC system subunit [Paenibacillaceae bacterium]|nr:UvrABC system subunit [Paenibacillaceae bacterium]